MPMLENYRHYFDIDPDYFPAVNEAVISKNPEMWTKFFPHETFVTLIRNTVSVLDRRQKVSLWVEGAYGTGKSHAVLTLKKLLDASEEDTCKYFEKYEMDNDLCSNFRRIKNSGKILTVHRYGSASIHSDHNLIFAIQESIEKTMAERGIVNKGGNALKDAAIKWLSDTDNKNYFNSLITGAYLNLFNGDNVDVVIGKLSTLTGDALARVMDNIFKVADERQIRALAMNTTALCEWIREIISANSLKAIVFIWDEFTEYFYNNSRNLTGFQELCELSETAPFYFIIVTHASTSLFNERDQDFRKLNGRFLNPHSLISLPENIAFKLMGAAMEKNKDAEVAKDWKMITDDLASRTVASRKLVKGTAHITDEEMLDILPIHPYTALLLKYISAAFGSNQRSMFDFIKNDRGDEIKGFQWFIDNYGPIHDNPFLTIDMLWEFFYDKGKEHLTHDIRTILDYYNHAGNQQLPADERRVLKTVLLLQAISQNAADSVELFIANEKSIENAFEGSDLDTNRAVRCAEKLVLDKVLFKKSLGGNKFQYCAYINEVSGIDLKPFLDRIDKKTTTQLITEELTDGTNITATMALNGALKLRYELHFVSSTDVDSKIRNLRGQGANLSNKIVAVVCFAKDDAESVTIGRKIRDTINSGNNDIVFIDATRTPFGADGYEQYRNDMAQSMYQQGKDNALARQYGRNAQDTLNKWKNRIMNGEFVVFSDSTPSGERASTMEALCAVLETINKNKFPNCLEGTYNVIANMYVPNSLKQGVECGANQKPAGTFLSANPLTKLDNVLTGAWKVEKYWISSPHLLISKIKLCVDKIITDAFTSGRGRISIKQIYDVLSLPPYGFMPCNLSAFILGFVLKEYTTGNYTWSDGLTNDVLDVNKLKEMVEEIIRQQITYNQRYKDKYIVTMTNEEKAFNEAASTAFNIPLNLCTSVEQTRERIRNKMKEFTFPIWTLKSILANENLKTETAVLETLIDKFCGIANNNNLDKTATDSDFAIYIGKTCIEHHNASKDLQIILTKEKCAQGMTEYLKAFENGELISLASSIGDSGQYINVLRAKFNTDAANWVWNIDTAEQKIREVILEYKIIYESNKILSKQTTFDATVREWCNKCQYIRISFAVLKNHLNEIAPFMEMLYTIKMSGQLFDSQKQNFYNLLALHGEAFRNFYDKQIDIFKNVCAYYLNGISDEEINEIYHKLSAGVFVYEKDSYLNSVEKIVNDYKNTLKSTKLKNLWRHKTGSVSPREWSKEHKMPILCLINEEEWQKAKDAFGTINRSKADAHSIDRAIEYLENANFINILNNKDALDIAFCKVIIKDYAVMLTDIEEVKNYLNAKIQLEPYDWIGLPQVDSRLRDMAEAKYVQSGCKQALKKIDEMDIADAREYLKNLIKDNMTVGMEIIKRH